jgi:Tropinone reductase 1
MSKGGLLQLTRSLATELAAADIRVNSISPWYTKTPLTESVLQQEERMEKILARTPLKRVAEPEEIASIISFLAMEHSSYITGQNLIADGGLFANALG